MSFAGLYHVGIVVPDIEAARQHFTDVLGVAWGPIVLTEAVEVRDGDGNDRVLPSRICYSSSAPHLELIEEQAGTPWVCNEHSNLHHIGFFSDAVAADSAGISAAACPLELAGRQGAESPTGFVYHRDPLGVRIELVDAAQRSLMEEHFFRAQAVDEVFFPPTAPA